MGSDLFRVKKFSGKIFSRRYPIEKRPPPPKEKSVFDQFGRFFFGYIGIGEIIYGKIGGDFILKFFMDFVENGLILLRGFFLGFFLDKRGPEILDEKSGRKFAHAIAPRLLGADGQV